MNKQKQIDANRGLSPSGLVFVIILFGSIAFFFGCRAGNEVPENAAIKRDSTPPPKVTVLADLPDSLQPKVVFLSDHEKPLVNKFKMPDPLKIFFDSITGRFIPREFQGKGWFNQYTAESGLPSDYIHNIYQDKLGRLWFCTLSAGVSCFDGHTFTVYDERHGLAHNRVWNVLEDRNGIFWFGTYGGLSKFDGKTFTNYTTENGLAHNDIANLLEDKDGNIWFSSISSIVSRFDGKKIDHFNEANGVISDSAWKLYKDKKETIWLATRKQGLFYYTPAETDTVVKFRKFNGPPSWIETSIMDIEEDTNGYLWIGTANNGLWHVRDSAFTQYTSNDGLINNCVINLLIDREGKLWAGNCRGGFLQFNGRYFENLNEGKKITSNLITGLLQDEDGNIWFGTYGSGAFVYAGSAINSFTSKPLDHDLTNAVEDNCERFWFGSQSNGFVLYDTGSYYTLNKSHGLGTNIVSSPIIDQSQNLWVCTFGGGVSHIEFPKNDIQPGRVDNCTSLAKQDVIITTYKTQNGMSSDYVNTILENEDGTIWFGTYGAGLTKFDGTSFLTYTTQQGLASDEISALLHDSYSNTWIYYSEPRGLTFYDGISFVTYTKDHGLSSNALSGIMEDRHHNLWIGTNTGLSILTNTELKKLRYSKNSREFPSPPAFENYNTTNGLPDENIWLLKELKNGNVALATRSGMILLHGGINALQNPDSLEVISMETGYPFTEISSIFEDRQGILWITTGSDKTGMIRFDYKSLHKNESKPDVIIKRIKIDDTPLTWNNLPGNSRSSKRDAKHMAQASNIEELSNYKRILSHSERDSLRNQFGKIKFDSVTGLYPIPQKLSLPFQHNHIGFDFTAIKPFRNKEILYQWTLEGYDDNWNPVSESHSASFGNMKEGHYTFLVKARSPEGVWSDPYSYSFVVQPPLYRTWWAYSLYAVFLIGTLYFLFQIQKKRTIRIEQEKNKQRQAVLNERLRISRELHDEVGATLSGITMYSHIAKEQIDTAEREVVKSSLNVIQESSGEMVEKLSDIIWLINPDQSDLKKLADKLETFAERMTSIQNMELHFTADKTLEGLELPIEDRKNIYLICKEAINNAVKYSKAEKLNFDIERSDHTLTFRIADNGNGFDPSYTKRGNGLNNMVKRAEEMGAEFEMESRPNIGTKILLKYNIVSCEL